MKTPDEIAEQIGKTKRQVIARASALKISKNNYFTQEEIDIINSTYTGENLKELAEKLNRTQQLICRKAKELGLTQLGRKSVNRSIANARTGADKAKKHWESEKGKEIREQAVRKREARKAAPKKYHAQEYREMVRARTTKIWSEEKSPLRTPELKEKRAANMSKRMTNLLREKPEAVRSRGKGGTRSDIGIYVRSKWEANYARYLNFLVEKRKIHKWEYEPDTFYFEHIKRGSRSYTPDFKVWTTPDTYEYHEVKGYMDPKSQTKLKRMKKYYPNEKVIMIEKEEYSEVGKWSRLISGWE